MKRGYLLLVLAGGLLAACGTPPQQTGGGGFGAVRDGAPPRTLQAEDIADAEPRYEPLLPRGNVTPYVVYGEEYHLVSDYRGFRQRGTASWYGTKFHGRKTSNGEIYDLYAMTAAHKTLPIPLYVRVTNLENGRQAIVRVNDRGPFHSDRIIDLSYAAAVKLGFAERGTAPVEIEVIDTDNTAQQKETGHQYYLQVAAFRQLDSARRLESLLSAAMRYPVQLTTMSDAAPVMYRVRIGPLKDFSSVQDARTALLPHWSGEPSLLVEDDTQQ